MEALTKTPAQFARERRLIDAAFDEACVKLGREEALIETVIRKQHSALKSVPDNDLAVARAEADRLLKSQLDFLADDARTKAALSKLRHETILKSHRLMSDYLTRLNDHREDWYRHAIAGGWAAPRPAYSGNVIAFPWKQRIADEPMSPVLRRRDHRGFKQHDQRRRRS